MATTPSPLDSRFGSAAMAQVAGATTFPQNEMREDVAYQIISDELFLDGNARQNLATFCQTWDDDNVHKLMDQAINKNWIDKEEYPQSAAIDLRCVNMVADLWNAPKPAGGRKRSRISIPMHGRRSNAPWPSSGEPGSRPSKSSLRDCSRVNPRSCRG